MHNDLSNEVIIHQEQNGIQYLQFRKLLGYESLAHCITTKIDGTDSPMDMSLAKHGCEAESVVNNYNRICSVIGIDYRNLVLSNQVHESDIRIVGLENRGEGILKPELKEGYDGLATNQPGVALAAIFADCVPVIFYDPLKNVAAICHAGWRGTVRRIAVKTVKVMQEEYNCDLHNIIACIGPSIGPCCFEVKEDTADQFRKVFDFWPEIIQKTSEDKYRIDLWKANSLQLMEAGVKTENIQTAGLCTSCNNDVFHSYRADTGKIGRLAAIVELK